MMCCLDVAPLHTRTRTPHTPRTPAPSTPESVPKTPPPAAAALSSRPVGLAAFVNYLEGQGSRWADGASPPAGTVAVTDSARGCTLTWAVTLDPLGDAAAMAAPGPLSQADVANIANPIDDGKYVVPISGDTNDGYVAALCPAGTFR